MMLSRAMLLDMSNADDFESSADVLSNTEYAVSQPVKDFSIVQQMLLDKRIQVRNLFRDLILDNELDDLLRARSDFANLRLGLRRKLTDKSLGDDYNDEGSVPASQMAEVFESEDYTVLPEFIQEAVEAAVIAYYQDKDIRRIDYALDQYHAWYRLQKAQQLGSSFLAELFRMRIDLTNITTMFRIKFTEMDLRDVFLDGGYVEADMLIHGLDVDYDAMGAYFFAMPYVGVIESGVNYLTNNKSFLKLERNCEEHINGYLNSAMREITAGHQPVVAYLLLKEYEIRMVRLILTAKRCSLEPKLITDRLGE
jgi:V/A-type H+-transporting ATPase subunit C